MVVGDIDRNGVGSQYVVAEGEQCEFRKDPKHRHLGLYMRPLQVFWAPTVIEQILTVRKCPVGNSGQSAKKWKQGPRLPVSAFAGYGTINRTYTVQGPGGPGPAHFVTFSLFHLP